MSKIVRYQGDVRAFASDAQGMERTVFGGTNQADDLTSQITASFLRGWGIVGASEHPSLEDFNAAMYAMSQFIAYQHQMGVPEWHAEQEYHIGSICTHNGESYQSLQNANIGSQPPSAKWTPVLTSKNGLANLGLGDGSGRYSKTVVFSLSGSYTWPADVKRIDVILTAGGGGGGGCNAESTNQTFSGSGGGAGGTVFATIYATDNNAGPGTYTVTIGAGGGGAGGAGSGNNGGNSSFMTLTALGGQGGQWVGATNTAGGRGGLGSGGYKTEQGGDGSDGQAGQALLAGNGASSYWGGGGRAGQLRGNHGVCSGSGGGGAYDNSYSHTSGSGGHGANGVLVIREYM